jgi:hypothetical protein
MSYAVFRGYFIPQPLLHLATLNRPAWALKRVPIDAGFRTVTTAYGIPG